jgi:hypothetical protein
MLFGCIIFSSIYAGLKCCPSLLDATDIRVHSCNFLNHSLFFATSKNSPTNKRCVLAADLVFQDADTIRNSRTWLKQLLHWAITFSKLRAFSSFPIDLGYCVNFLILTFCCSFVLLCSFVFVMFRTEFLFSRWHYNCHLYCWACTLINTYRIELNYSYLCVV